MIHRCADRNPGRPARALTLCALAWVVLAGVAQAVEPSVAPDGPAPAQPAAAARGADAMPAVRSDPGAAAAATGAPAPAAPAQAPAAAKEGNAEPKTLDDRIQDTKNDVIQLNRDLLVLEEELLFPANTQVAIFVSMDVGKLFELDSVQVRLDNQEVAGYLYTPAEVAALHRGGVQRVFLGNLRAGPHELVAFFTGKGPHDRDYRRGATVKFDKGTDARYIELQIKDSTGALQPEFSVKLWQ